MYPTTLSFYKALPWHYTEQCGR